MLSTAEHLLPDARLPLYQQLRDALAGRIAEGTWGPGEAIASEQQIAREFSVALGTVRRAIGELVDQGVLDRQQGRGTFVRRADFRHSLFRFFRLRSGDGSEIRPEGRLLGQVSEKADPVTAERLGLRAGAPVIRLHRLRLHNGQALLVEHIWLPRAPFKALLSLGADDWEDLLYPLYERVCGRAVARAQDHLSFVPVRGDDAKRLGIKPGMPAVQVERVAFGFDDRPLEWRRSYGNAELFSYTVDLK